MVEGADDRAFLRMHPPPLEKGTVVCHLGGAVQGAMLHTYVPRENCKVLPFWLGFDMLRALAS